ncbi:MULTISPECIES: lmo0937 family membrane protein [Metabacillus]|uniref:lmo0937 family membrane protein n=1 Tax=Metabacillus TaxID=2675233 RepID=UPI000B265FFB|nr:MULTISPECIES: lmo0937 family membrane protein [Metabacillus]MDX8291258.1 lmo0937 family membrane protein [Metabacillus indicus]
MLWTIIGLLILFWILGLVFKVAGGIIHILLVLALIVFLYNFFMKRKGRARG